MPLPLLIEICARLESRFPVEALGAELAVLPGVLVPGPQAFINTWRDAIERAASSLTDARFLDVGCGSGVLSCLAARTGFAVVASDADSAALTTTRINAKVLGLAGRIATVGPADLFDAAAGSCFDVIAFNAPWVNSPRPHRLELATHDHEQHLITRFLQQVSAHFSQRGRLLLGYSNYSGQQCLERVEQLVGENQLAILERTSCRIKAQRARVKHERAYVYVIARA